MNSKTTRGSLACGSGISVRASRLAAVSVAALLGLSSGAQAMCTTPSFKAHHDLAVANNPTTLAMGDFNGDGNMDLAVATGDANVAILLGDGSGGFGGPTTFAAGASGTATLAITVGHIDGDSNLDIAVTDVAGDTVSVLLGHGDGSFGAASSFTVGSVPIAVALTDLDGDGHADLVVLSYYPGEVSVLWGAGDGTFPTATHVLAVDDPAADNPTSFVVGDFDQDGKQDLAVTNSGDAHVVSLLFGAGGRTFRIPSTQLPVGGDAWFVASADFNGDSKEDLAVAKNAFASVAVLLGDGSGGFGAASSFAVGASPFSVTTGDFNGDGKMDLAVANQGANTVSVLLGNGSGGFGAATDFPVGSAPGLVAAGDFDGDGRMDLAVTNTGTSSVSVLLNTCGAQGAPCSSGSDCDNGICADGVCCDTACGGSVTTDCQACSVAAGAPTDGTCSPLTGTSCDLSDGCPSDTCHGGVCQLGCAFHDTVVLSAKPVTVTIPVGRSSVTKKLSIRVRNADTTHTTGHLVRLDVDASACGGVAASTPAFPGTQNPFTIGDGKTKTATTVLTVTSGAATQFNRHAVHRCTLTFTGSTVPAALDLTPSNNTLPVELNIRDLNAPDPGPVAETTIASLKPMMLSIVHGKSSKTANAKFKVGNADAVEGQILVSATAANGSCPPETVTLGGIHLVGSAPPEAPSMTIVPGGATRSGTLPVTVNAISTPNQLAPQRCVATVSATGPSGDTDATNNTTQLVIDVINKN